MKLHTIYTCITMGVALLLVSPRSYGQADALVDMLQKKGLITQREANEVKDQMMTDVREQMPGTKLNIASWLDELKISGDMRLRYDEFFSQYQDVVTASSGNGPSRVGFEPRSRYRYRLRLGMEAKAGDFTAGFRLATGDQAGPTANPLSNNTTFDNSAAKKNINVDQAYLAWTPSFLSEAHARFVGGKMEDPYWETNLILDPDLTPEGFAETFNHSFGNFTPFLTVGQFVVEEVNSTAVQTTTNNTGNDVWLFAEQVGFTWDAMPKIVQLKSAVGVYQFTNLKEAVITAPGAGNPGWNTPLTSAGSLNGAAIVGPRANNFNVVTFNNALTLSTGKFLTSHPLILSGEYANNLSAANRNEAWMVGLTLGQAKTKGQWQASYYYEWLEADAMYDQWMDDDFGYGGTNKRGHVVALKYQATDFIQFALTYYNQDYIDQSLPGLTNPTLAAAGSNSGPGSGTERIIIDCSMKF
jgi:hypothetical protein